MKGRILIFVMVFLLCQKKTLGQPENIHVLSDSASFLVGFDVADLDGDNDVDVAAIEYNSIGQYNLIWYENNDELEFEEKHFIAFAPTNFNPIL